MRLFILSLLVMILFSCGRKSTDTSPNYPGPNTPPNTPGPNATDPSILTDVYEREQWVDCSGSIIVDKVVRHPGISTIKVNPDRNFFIDSSSFLNYSTQQEFTSHTWFPGPGGDNYKLVRFCQAPKDSGCDMFTNDGENIVEYKYWSYKRRPCDNDPSMECKTDVLEEQGTRILTFTHVRVNSDKICRRTPNECPMKSVPTWGACQYP